jgi:DNA-directed RNA polymerase specialized sigma24 family protein
VDTEVKVIIDKHFSDNIEYYKTICRNWYKDRYLWEDLLQEAYLGMLKVRPEVVKYSPDTAYLKHIGKKVISSILQKRNYHKKHVDGSDSVLFETSNNAKEFNFDIFEHNQECKKDTEELIDKINSIVYDGLLNKDFETEVFVMAQIESISSISRRTGVNYYSVSKANKTAIERIKKQLQ